MSGEAEENDSGEASISRPRLELPDRGSIFAGELGTRGHWLVANLATGISWPIKTHQIAYRGRTFVIIPVTKDSGPAVALRTQGGSGIDGHTAILRFLSALAWSEDRGIGVTNFSGGSLPFPATSQHRGNSITEDFCVRDLPEPDRQKVWTHDLLFARNAMLVTACRTFLPQGVPRRSNA